MCECPLFIDSHHNEARESCGFNCAFCGSLLAKEGITSANSPVTLTDSVIIGGMLARWNSVQNASRGSCTPKITKVKDLLWIKIYLALFEVTFNLFSNTGLTNLTGPIYTSTGSLSSVCIFMYESSGLLPQRPTQDGNDQIQAYLKW